MPQTPNPASGLLSHRCPPRTRALPGRAAVISAIYLWYVVAMRGILVDAGLALPYRLVSQVGNTIVTCLLLAGLLAYIRQRPVRRLLSKSHRAKSGAWFLCVAMYAAYGIARGNDLTSVGKEACGCLCLGVFILIGADDDWWTLLCRHLTILFYVGCLVVTLYYQTPMIQVAGNDVFRDYSLTISAERRYAYSLGYNLRALTAAGWMLTAWGLSQRRPSVLRSFQIGALAGVVWTDVALFVHRSSAAIAVMVIVSSIVLRPVFERRARISAAAAAIAAACIAVALLFASGAVDLLDRRVSEETQREPLFESRNAELSACLRELGFEFTVGRGLGGHFDVTGAGAWAPGNYIGKEFSEWKTLHYGICVLALKGGVVLAGVMVSFLVPLLKHRRRQWYESPANVCAGTLVPAVLAMLILNPIPLSIEGLPYLVAIAMCLSRFGLEVNHRPVGAGFAVRTRSYAREAHGRGHANVA